MFQAVLNSVDEQIPKKCRSVSVTFLNLTCVCFGFKLSDCLDCSLITSNISHLPFYYDWLVIASDKTQKEVAAYLSIPQSVSSMIVKSVVLESCFVVVVYFHRSHAFDLCTF